MSVRAASAAFFGSLFVAAAPGSHAQQLPDCAQSDSSYTTLIQTVRDATTRVPLASADVAASWGGRIDALRARTDSTGVVRICAPRATAVTLRISLLGWHAGPTTTFVPRGDSVQRLLTVDAPGVLVRGIVIDNATGSAVPNAAVQLANTPLRAVTGQDGRFAFERVPLGDYNLRVEHIAYAARGSALNVRAQDLDASVRLSAQAIPLDPVVVTAFSRRLESVGFYEREKRGVGTFLGRKQIDQMNVHRASDLLRRVPSARLIPQAGRRGSTSIATTGRGNCRYLFIVDGTRTLPDFEMDLMVPWLIEGVEIYNGVSETPANFRASAGPESEGRVCGVVVIWTRDRR